MAFPKLNLMSWYLNVGGGMLALVALLLGGVDTGWTFYTPYSSLYSNSYVTLAAAGVFIAGFGSIATGLNFIVTVHTQRHRGHDLDAPAALRLVDLRDVDHHGAGDAGAGGGRSSWWWPSGCSGSAIFDPALGGDPLLFQHVFWFYSHPAVYIMILPGMGVVTEVLTCFARRRVFGYEAMVFAILAIAIFGFFVWGHHMFVSGQSGYASLVFSLLSLRGGGALGDQGLQLVGDALRRADHVRGVDALCAGVHRPVHHRRADGAVPGLGADRRHVHDTYFVVAHFHYIMVGGMVTAFFAGLHFWWPKMTGRTYSEPFARLAALLMFVGFNATFFPQFMLGYLGMPRRYWEYPDRSSRSGTCCRRSAR